MSAARRTVARPRRRVVEHARGHMRRYQLPTALEARRALLAELGRHGFDTVHRLYAAGEIREKRVASVLGALAETWEPHDAYRAKVARGAMFLACALHEGKHNRAASPDALRVFWSHMERVHGERPRRSR